MRVITKSLQSDSSLMHVCTDMDIIHVIILFESIVFQTDHFKLLTLLMLLTVVIFLNIFLYNCTYINHIFEFILTFISAKKMWIIDLNCSSQIMQHF